MKQLTVILQLLMVLILAIVSVEVYSLTKEIKGIRQEQVKNRFAVTPPNVAVSVPPDIRRIMEVTSYIDPKDILLALRDTKFCVREENERPCDW